MRHRDYAGRVSFKPRSDRYLHHNDGYLRNMYVACVDDIYEGPGTSTWKRTYVRKVAPLKVRIATWIIDFSYDPKSWEDWGIMLLRTFPAAIGMALCVSSPILSDAVLCVNELSSGMANPPSFSEILPMPLFSTNTTAMPRSGVICSRTARVYPSWPATTKSIACYGPDISVSCARRSTMRTEGSMSAASSSGRTAMVRIAPFPICSSPTPPSTSAIVLSGIWLIFITLLRLLVALLSYLRTGSLAAACVMRTNLSLM